MYLRWRYVVGDGHPLAVGADQFSEPAVELLIRHPHGKRLSTNTNNLHVRVGRSALQANISHLRFHRMT